MKQETVCRVDDDILYQFTARKLLEKMDCVGEVLVFSDGEQASNYLLKHLDEKGRLPSIIFLDINMPFMDGWGFLENIKRRMPQQASKMRIHVVSSSPAREDRLKAHSYPEVDDYIVKPITTDIFREKIEELG